MSAARWAAETHTPWTGRPARQPAELLHLETRHARPPPTSASSPCHSWLRDGACSPAAWSFVLYEVLVVVSGLFVWVLNKGLFRGLVGFCCPAKPSFSVAYLGTERHLQPSSPLPITRIRIVKVFSYLPAYAVAHHLYHYLKDDDSGLSTGSVMAWDVTPA